MAAPPRSISEYRWPNGTKSSKSCVHYLLGIKLYSSSSRICVYSVLVNIRAPLSVDLPELQKAFPWKKKTYSAPRSWSGRPPQYLTLPLGNCVCYYFAHATLKEKKKQNKTKNKQYTFETVYYVVQARWERKSSRR